LFCSPRRHGGARRSEEEEGVMVLVFGFNREWTRMDANISEEMGLFVFIGGLEFV